MLQNKGIAKIQEIITFFDDSWTQPEFFSKQLALFNFSKTSKFITSIKQSGISAWDILTILFVMPFTNTPTINSLYSTNTKLTLK